MTLSRYYNPSVKPTHEINIGADFYSTTHYLSGGDLFPLLNYLFLNKEAYNKFIADRGFESIRDRPYELVSLLVYLNGLEPVDVNESKEISKEDMEKTISEVEFTEDIHQNIVNLLGKFGYEYKGKKIDNKIVTSYFDEKISPLNFYFCSYNIIFYSTALEVYNHEIQDIFYLLSDYIQPFCETFNLDRLSITSLCRRFGVGTKLPDIIKYSTVHKYLNMEDKVEGNISKTLHGLQKYSDEALVKKFNYKDEYNSRLDLISSILSQ